MAGWESYFTTTSAPSADTRHPMTAILQYGASGTKAFNQVWQNTNTGVAKVNVGTASGPNTINSTWPYFAFINTTSNSYQVSLLTAPGTVTQSNAEGSTWDLTYWKIPGVNAAMTQHMIFGTNVSADRAMLDLYDTWKTLSTFTGATVQLNWWNGDWRFRTQITKNGTGSLGRFSMNSIPGFSMSQIQSNGADIKYMDHIGNELPFSKLSVNATDAVLELSNAGTLPTWLYWGNPDIYDASFTGSAVETKWWNVSWLYKARITKTGNHPLGRFSLTSILGFAMSQLLPGGADIRYIDPTGRVEWPFSNITINATDAVLELFNNETAYAWMYWGNPYASAANPPNYAQTTFTGDLQS